MKRKTSRHAATIGNEDGLVLPMVLVMITVVAVISVALLSLATTTLAASRVAKSTAERTYAAHAGIDAAIQQIRAGATLCSDNSKLPVKVNGRPTVVTCSPASDSFDVGAGGWAVFVNGTATPNPGISTSNAVNAGKVITGPVYNGGRWTDTNALLQVSDGQVLSSAAGCGDAGFTNNVVTQPVANFKACVGGPAPAPAVAPSLPTISDALLPATLVPGGSTVTGSGANACRIFTPGVFTSAAQLLPSPYMYFTSGVYLLDNVGKITIGKSRKAVAGRAYPGYTAALDVTAQCPSGDAGFGAMFLLSGNSSIEVTDGGQFEIHPFLPAVGSKESPVAIRTVDPVDVGKRVWLTAPSTLDTGGAAFASSKNKTKAIIRGVIYAPYALVSIDPRGNSPQTVLSAGVVAGRFDLSADAAISSDQLQIGSGGASGIRRIQIRSEAVERLWCGCSIDTDPTGSSRRIIAYATVAITGSGAMTIESWRIGT